MTRPTRLTAEREQLLRDCGFPFIGDLFAELDALRLERTWQPIATAPKDGTEVLVWVNREPAFSRLVAHFQTQSKVWWHWCDYSYHPLKHTPTHWQPLPLAPAGGKP